MQIADELHRRPLESDHTHPAGPTTLVADSANALEIAQRAFNRCICTVKRGTMDKIAHCH
jgi:hypothetical protein